MYMSCASTLSQSLDFVGHIIYMYMYSACACHIGLYPTAPPSPREPAPVPGMGGRRDPNGSKAPRPSPVVAQKPRRDSFKRENSTGVPATPPANTGEPTSSFSLSLLSMHVHVCRHVLCLGFSPA